MVHDELVEKGLVQATWGLAAVTALLVIMAIIPVLRDAADRRAQRRRISAGLVPDMIILRSRLTAARDKLAGYRKWSEEDIRDQIGSAGHESSMLIRIITQGDRPSLLFVNELYLVRHLLTQASLRLTSAYAGIRSRLPGETGSRNRNLLAYRLAGFNLLRRVFPTVAEASARAAAEHTTNDRPAIAGRENNSASSRLAESIVSHRPGIWPMAGPPRGSRMRSEHMGHSQPTVIAVGSALWIISTSFSGMKKGSEGFGGIGEDRAFGVLRVADRNNARMRGYFNALSVPHAAARLTPGDSAVAGIYR
jgi:hypothetical protein